MISSTLRSFVLLSLLGVAVLVLIGPVLAIAGVLLPFALIGLLAWGAYHGVRALRNRIRAGRGLPGFGRRDARRVVALQGAPRPGPWGAATARALAICGEVTCGAAVGCGLALLAAWQQEVGFELAALGAVIGAVVGFVVGGSRPALPRREQAGKDAPRLAA
jgi:hypothetical protein